MRATLTTFKQTEAGASNAPLDYNSWNSDDNFTEKTYAEDSSAYESHPGANTNGRTSASAYQFMERFYEGDDFSPESQDKAAVDLKGAKGREAAKSGDITKVKDKLSGKWTSLASFTDKALKELFKKAISAELSGKSKIATPQGKLKTDK